MMCLCVSVCVLSDVEVDVDELNQEQVMDLNKMATPYGMAEGDFVRWHVINDIMMSVVLEILSSVSIKVKLI